MTRLLLWLCLVMGVTGMEPLSAQIPTRVPARRLCRITAVGGMVLPTRENGQCWDIGCFGKKQKLHKVSEFLREVKEIIHWRTVLARDAFKFAAAGTHLPDPYVVIKINGTQVLRTKKSPNTLLPMWGESVTVPLSVKDTLEVYVYDWDRFTSDDPMGFYATVGIPSKYVEVGGIMKLQFGRVHELQLMFKPLDDEHPISSATPMNSSNTSSTVIHPKLPLPRARPDSKVPLPRAKPDIKATPTSTDSVIGVAIPPARHQPKPVQPETRPLSPTQPETRPLSPTQPKMRPLSPIQPETRPLSLVPVIPAPDVRHPTGPLSPQLLAINQQIAGLYRVDKTKMLEMVKILQQNMHRLPPSQRPAAQLNIDMALGLQMILRLGVDYSVHFSTTHRWKQSLVHRKYQGVWSWYVPGKILTLHVMEKPKSKKKRQNLTLSCVYRVPKVICSNVFGRNHRHSFVPDPAMETPR